MAESAEVLITSKVTPFAERMLRALTAAIPGAWTTATYRGGADWLILYGYGAPEHNKARQQQLKAGGHCLAWDLGYVARKTHLRCTIDTDHPPQYFNFTPENPSRWHEVGSPLREDSDPNGHILLIGLGRKSRSYLRLEKWEQLKLYELRSRFPGRRIVYRPKPGSPAMNLDCETDHDSPIDYLLRGCALASCRHSNVACDAALAGVPFECEDGAARWLAGRPFTPENRLAFLYRLAWWQWKAEEAGQAWDFIRSISHRYDAETDKREVV